MPQPDKSLKNKCRAPVGLAHLPPSLGLIFELAIVKTEEIMTIKSITPFLWFDTQAEDAANCYVSLFPNSRIIQVSRYGDHGPGPKGSVSAARVMPAARSDLTVIDIPWGSRAIRRFLGPPCSWCPSMDEFGQ